MSRYVDRRQSFVNGAPVYLVDAVAAQSPFAQFLADKGAMVQPTPDATTRFVVSHHPLDQLPPHLFDAVEATLAAGAVFLSADNVRVRLTRAPGWRPRDRALRQLLGSGNAAFVGV